MQTPVPRSGSVTTISGLLVNVDHKKHSETFSVSVSVSSIQMHPVLLPSEQTPGLRTVVATPWLGHTLRLGNWTHNDSHWLQVLQSGGCKTKKTDMFMPYLHIIAKLNAGTGTVVIWQSTSWEFGDFPIFSIPFSVFFSTDFLAPSGFASWLAVPATKRPRWGCIKWTGLLYRPGCPKPKENDHLQTFQCW